VTGSASALIEKYILFIRRKADFSSKFKNKLRTICNLRTNKQVFAVDVVYKIAANTVQLANCILLHAYSRAAAVSSCVSANKNVMLIKKPNSIFDYKLRTNELLKLKIFRVRNS